jgi:hypothetical protein
MSVEFSLNGNSLVEDQWIEVIKGALADLELEAYPQFQDLDFHGGDLQILCQGSIRGVSVHLENPTRVRLSSFSSRVDWQLAFVAMRQALSRGGGDLDKEGLPFAGDQLTEDKAFAEFADAFAADVRSTARIMGENSVTLPISYFNCPLSGADFPNLENWGAADTEAAEALLQARVERYADCYLASVMQLQPEGSSEIIRLSNYYHGPTLFQKSVDYLSMSGETRSIDGMIKRETVEEILADYLEDAGEQLWYLPAIDFHAETALYDALSAAAEGKFGGGASDDSDAESACDPEIQEMSFRLLRAMMQGQPTQVAAEIMSSGHPKASEVMSAVSALMRAMSGDEPPSPAELMIMLATEDGVSAEVAANIVQMMAMRAEELSSAATEEPEPDEDSSEVVDLAFNLLVASLSGKGEQGAVELLETEHEDAQEILAGVAAVIQGMTESGASGDPDLILTRLGEAEVSPRIRTLVAKMIINRGEELQAAIKGGKSGCLSMLIAGFVLLWQVLL